MSAEAKDILSATQPWLRRLNHDNKEELTRDLAKLEIMAGADNHTVWGATHVAELNGEMIGYASIGAVPMINLWLNSKVPRPRDAISLLNMVENEAARAGFRVVCIPCDAKSPFRPMMERFGYRFLMESGYFTKKLRG
jgi:hypothetical protein